ncbi:MAG: hypothetical protein KAX93_03000 [Flavobacterium sp.]|nr:hypothetical protein [Flavobacterium sp.]MBP8157321.1 hypothetical protein [Flavobacterium sp.]
MKKVPALVLLLVTLFSVNFSFSQDNSEPEALGLPGDNLSLYAVLEVFQKSKTIEDFEKALNDKEGNVNNLDLNNDNDIDYIKVISEKDGDNHSIILQVPVSEKENQDVAVIEVSKDNSGKAIVQIIGDEELYGKDYIVEPSTEVVGGTPNPGYTGGDTVIINNNTTNNYNTTNTTNNSTSNNNGASYVEPSGWSVVLFLFSPIYVAYRSPFYWGFYPPYWSPWRPIYYHNYWGYNGHYHHHNHYRRTTVIINNNHYHNRYHNRRSSSSIVANNRREGRYNSVYDGRTYKKPSIPSRNETNNRPSKPKTKPSTRPSKPTTKPSISTPRPSTKPTVSPSRPTKPVTKPSYKPSTKSVNRPVSRPTSRPAPKRSVQRSTNR